MPKKTTQNQTVYIFNSNPVRVNIFQLTSAVSDYHENVLFMYISEDDSEIELKHCTSSHGYSYISIRFYYFQRTDYCCILTFILFFLFPAAKPTFTQIAQWKAVLGKLSKFVRSVDLVVLELLRRLVVTAANTLLAKVQASAAEQYPCQQDVGEGSKTCDERDESSPPAILTIQLVLGMHEPGGSHEANSTLEKGEVKKVISCIF